MSRTKSRTRSRTKSSKAARVTIVLLLLLTAVTLLVMDIAFTASPVKAPANITTDGSTATSGATFSGSVIRKYVTLQAELSSPKPSRGSFLQFVKSNSPQYGLNCTRWAVMTTIFKVSQSVQNTARKMKGWCMVVVGDSSGPSSYNVELDDEKDQVANIFYLNADLQKELADTSDFVAALPWRHFGRKNVGYLWAILHNAVAVWDFDDDNELIVDQMVLPNSQELEGHAYEVLRHETDLSVAVNPYPIMGATNPASWPRGFPLTSVKEPTTQPTTSKQTIRVDDLPARIGVLQSLANHDPDVDAIYRLTQPLPLNFIESKMEDIKYLLIPKGKLSPYNAQATLHFKGALWGMLLPVTVHGRVSDIWRGYAMQRLMWDIDLQLGFAGPYVIQKRNAHNYLGDLKAEDDLYFKTDKLVEFLANEWSSDSPQLVQRIEELYVALYEREYLELADIQLLHLWLQELETNGYKFPSVRTGNGVGS